MFSLQLCYFFRTPSGITVHGTGEYWLWTLVSLGKAEMIDFERKYWTASPLDWKWLSRWLETWGNLWENRTNMNSRWSYKFCWKLKETKTQAIEVLSRVFKLGSFQVSILLWPCRCRCSYYYDIIASHVWNKVKNVLATHSRSSASTPGLKLVEFKNSPIQATVNSPDIPTSSPNFKEK